MKREIDDPRRHFLVTALSLGLFGGANLAQLFRPGHAMGEIPDTLPEGRSIYRLRGEVSVDGKPATLDTPIGPGSRVKTGSNSRVIFVVENDAFVLRSNSDLQMESDDGLFIQGMRILSGRLLSVFGKREEQHSITTVTATIGIRGTGIYVESDPEKSYVCTCYGYTRIIANADRNVSQDIVSKHHDEPVYVLPAASGDKLIQPGPFINHTDAELALIEELVGRTTPFAFSGGVYEAPRKRTY
jgi:hypothetical protein